MTSPTIIGALSRVLRPLVRILLRRGVAVETFEEVARRVYVDVAEADFALEGRKQSASRIGVLTGLNRKEVARLRSLPPPAENEALQRHNRAERVLTAWLREDEFLDEKLDPRVLPFEGEGSFSALVKQFSGDMPARAVADELVRVGSVEQLPDGSLRLRNRGYVPDDDDEQTVLIFGLHTADLLETFDRNLDAEAKEKLWQREVTYTQIPESAVGEFKRVSARWGQQTLEELDRWLAERKVDDDDEAARTVRLGFGMYQVQTPNDTPE